MIPKPGITAVLAKLRDNLLPGHKKHLLEALILSYETKCTVSTAITACGVDVSCNLADCVLLTEDIFFLVQCFAANQLMARLEPGYQSTFGYLHALIEQHLPKSDDRHLPMMEILFTTYNRVGHIGAKLYRRETEELSPFEEFVFIELLSTDREQVENLRPRETNNG